MHVDLLFTLLARVTRASNFLCSLILNHPADRGKKRFLLFDTVLRVSCLRTEWEAQKNSRRELLSWCFVPTVSRTVRERTTQRGENRSVVEQEIQFKDRVVSATLHCSLSYILPNRLMQHHNHKCNEDLEVGIADRDAVLLSFPFSTQAFHHGDRAENEEQLAISVDNSRRMAPIWRE